VFLKVLALDEESNTVILDPALAATSRIGPTSGTYSFKFDHVLPVTCEQALVFESVGRQACHHFLDGYNVAIFAYGQTGAGKTYTMYGRGGVTLAPQEGAGAGPGGGGDFKGTPKSTVAEKTGLVPRCLFYIFSRIQELRARGCQCDIKVSFIEIYNETVIDLLTPNARLVTLREDSLKDRIFVEGAFEPKVESLEEVVHLLNVGEQNRTTGATAINKQSSRSHSVFTIALEAAELLPDGRQGVRQSQSTFRLVDLAGSERQKYSKSEGRHLREASNINRSLTVLGKVIMALASGSKHVPYRDSKLTFLLKNSLGGNSKTILIANIALAAKCQDESLSTLKFASFARKPLIKVSKNFLTPDANITDLENQVQRLKAQLHKARKAPWCHTWRRRTPTSHQALQKACLPTNSRPSSNRVQRKKMLLTCGIYRHRFIRHPPFFKKNVVFIIVFLHLLKHC
jgi:kinesin family member 15